jgi:hypothetical protein
VGVAVVGRVSRLFLVALGLWWVASGTSHSQEIPGYPLNVYAGDPREMAMVPKYCMYTQSFRNSVPGGNDQRMIDAWMAEMGDIFHALHHYCAGLIKANRALLLARGATDRRFYLSDAIIEYDYVIVRAPLDFVLLPEIVTKKGEALAYLGKGPLAVFEFEHAIELKADYWPAYAHLSDYYTASGELRKAREVLDAGLAKRPDAKALLRRVAELDAAPSRPAKR